MKILKRIQTLALAAIMAVMTLGNTTVFAAETPVITETVAEENSNIETRSGLETVVNQTFNISVSHTGSTRTYNYNYISFGCIFTDQNGNQLPNGSTILAIRLYDATTGQKVNEWQSSDGSVVSGPIAINKSHRYYFQYIVAYGTPNLSLQMLIQGQIV